MQLNPSEISELIKKRIETYDAKAEARTEARAAWEARALGWIRVMKVDASLSLVIYTAATVAFYFLGAAVLHREGLQVEAGSGIARHSSSECGPQLSNRRWCNGNAESNEHKSQ